MFNDSQLKLVAILWPIVGDLGKVYFEKKMYGGVSIRIKNAEPFKVKNEIIKYWAWINENELGVVGTQSVYHISIKDINQSNNKLEAVKMFDREGPLSLS